MYGLFKTPYDWGLTWMRLCLGAVILPHGLQKAFGLFGGAGFQPTLAYFSHLGIPVFAGYLAVGAEFLGALGLIFGFLTRVGAFGIGLEMLCVIFLVHDKNGFFMNWQGNQPGEGFEYHILAIGLAAVLLVKGGGAASIDGLISRFFTRRRAVEGRHLSAA
jgi:putative oxidoreductase